MGFPVTIIHAIHLEQIMASDVNLQIDGITGESMDDKHKDWIECSFVNWGVHQG